MQEGYFELLTQEFLSFNLSRWRWLRSRSWHRRDGSYLPSAFNSEWNEETTFKQIGNRGFKHGHEGNRKSRAIGKAKQLFPSAQLRLIEGDINCTYRWMSWLWER
eukprot:TRINITY_DN287_c0_g1_i1.p2 TRINITY_DN287_c0_g1~~TRINITY_DN287_c0_g1_i1.p2  ORF type:complete len:105 (-),score=6.18 TRINITY_DN287_c0_g1_i1:3858-4172(-)